jgi:hypothetical protein
MPLDLGSKTRGVYLCWPDFVSGEAVGRDPP